MPHKLTSNHHAETHSALFYIALAVLAIAVAVPAAIAVMLGAP